MLKKSEFYKKNMNDNDSQEHIYDSIANDEIGLDIDFLKLDKNKVIQGIIYSEILGKPKAFSRTGTQFP